MTIAEDDRFIRAAEVKRLTGLDSVGVRKLAARGLFPPAYRLGLRSCGWSYLAVRAWMESRQLATEKPPSYTPPPGRKGGRPRRRPAISETPGEAA